MNREFPDPDDPMTRQNLLLAAVKGVDFEPLFEVWRVSGGGINDDLESGLLAALYETFANKAVKKGEVFMVEELASRGRARAEAVKFDTKRFFQLQALALARSGATRKAADILMRLARVSDDSESSGLLARTFRDLGWEERNAAVRRGLFLEAYTHAAKSFERDHQYYNGIQAAQFAFFAGEADAVQSQLKKVEALCAEKMSEVYSPDSQQPFWINVTLAEAALIRGDLTQAKNRYEKMFEDEGRFPADTEATRQVAIRLIECHTAPKPVDPGGNARNWEVALDPDDLDALRKVLCPRPVVVFSGHLFDCAREHPRFPVDRAKAVSERLRAIFKEVRPRRVVFSLSMGADLLFAEEAIRFFESGMAGNQGTPSLPIDVVLAYDRDRAFSAAVAMVRRMAAKIEGAVEGEENGEPGDFEKEWHRRIRKVFQKIPYSCVHEAHYPEDGNPSDAYAHANALMAGIAYLEAGLIGTTVTPIVLHDGAAGETGGTGDFLAALRAGTLERVINLYADTVS